jgi:hypothetical protein
VQQGRDRAEGQARRRVHAGHLRRRQAGPLGEGDALASEARLAHAGRAGEDDAAGLGTR